MIFQLSLEEEDIIKVPLSQALLQAQVGILVEYNDGEEYPDH